VRRGRRQGPCVVDASVVAGALFGDDYADQARSLLASGRKLHAPDLVYAEVGNVIWKRYRRGEVSEAEAVELLADVLRLPLLITASDALLAAALRLAVGTGQTVYDCLYLALALQEKCVLLTGDRRLLSALEGGPLARHAGWVAASQ
jgi:predicted nucleic acid-binding protein